MLRVAILDNSAIARGLLRSILANDGYNVVSESGVASANLSRLALLAPQLVFIDLDAETRDPQATLSDLRSKLPKALIFAVSSAFTAERIRHAGEQGANGFIVKPFNGAAILSLIRTAIISLVKQQKKPGD
ncbi:MAG TPA: response regulator [Noviherbaspirillum sp.]